MSEFEKNVTEYEQLARKIIGVDKKLAQREKQLAKRGGIYGTGDGSLPSAFIRKERKRKQSGLVGGRLEDSKDAIGTLSSEKIRPTEEDKTSIVEGIMQALGIKKYTRKTAKDSLVSAGGRPIKNFDNEFTTLRTKVYGIAKNQKAFAKSLSQAQSLVQGVSALTTVGGIAGSITSLAKTIPYVGIIIGITTALVQQYLAQFGPGGARDKRKKILASDTSLIGIDNENVIASGEILFFSNPATLQGLPRGNSNTIDLRDGISRYKLRHQGSY